MVTVEKSDKSTSFEQEFWNHDWQSTSLGPVEGWRSTLGWSVDFILSSRDPVILIWGDQKTLLFNEAFTAILGHKYLEALGRPLELLWARVWDRVSPYVEDALGGSAAIVEDVPLQTWASGFRETRYFTFSYTPIKDREKTVLGASCTARDVTDAVLEKRRIRNERDILAEMFERAPGFIAMAEGSEHRFVFANAAYRKFIGREDIAGRRVAEVMPEIIGQGFIAILDEVYRSGEPFVGKDLPVQILNASGKLEQRFIDTVYQPLRDGAGEVTGIFAEGHDVTEHRRAREKLEEAEAVIRARAEHFRRTLDHIPQMVWSTRPDGYHDYFSQAWYEFTGVEEGSTDGAGWNDMFHPEDQKRAWELWRHSLATGDPYEIEYRLRHRNGEYRWLLGRAWPERAETGEIIRWYGTCTDIHDRIAAERRVADLQQELIHVAGLNAMGSMAATLAHEVNQPLAAAANYVVGVKRLIETGASSAALADPISEIEKTVHRAGDIIRRLRVMTNTRRLMEKQDCDPRQLIENASRLAEAALSQPFTVALDVEQGRRIRVDPVRIEQVLINFIKNAAEAMSGHPPHTITISAKKTGFEFIFCVADTGPGVPADLLPEVFEAFRSTKDDGMGIGLSVSRTIIEEHGGSIWAENAPEGGARFCFSLPIAEDNSAR
jgi:PAS domain S-box-containing protein